jgi:hypothetical protein
VHPDGPAAHIARHRAVTAAGWRILDGFPSRWTSDAPRAAAALAHQLTPPR